MRFHLAVSGNRPIQILADDKVGQASIKRLGETESAKAIMLEHAPSCGQPLSRPVEHPLVLAAVEV